MTTGFGQPYTTGTTAGGALDARGRLRAADQTPLTGQPGYPSVATNGTMSLLAWGRSGWATVVQFLDAAGKPAGSAVKVSDHGANAIPPRAVWTGGEWRVVLNETPDVVSLRIGPDGAVLERTVVATNATLADADGALIVVDEATVFTLEHERYAWTGVLWKATIAANGAVTREQLLTNVDAWELDATTTLDGIVASWQDHGAATRRLHVRDGAATRIFPVPDPFRSQRIFGGATPLVLWQGLSDLHVLFPTSGVDVIAGTSDTHLLLEALPLPDGSFDVAWAPLQQDATAITIVNVQPSGVVTPREELCFPAGAWFMTMRDGLVDALFTQQRGGAFVTKKGFPRRRAARQ